MSKRRRGSSSNLGSWRNSGKSAIAIEEGLKSGSQEKKGGGARNIRYWMLEV